MILTKLCFKLAISTNARDALRTHTFQSLSVGTRGMFRAISRWFRPTIQEGYTRLETEAVDIEKPCRIDAPLSLGTSLKILIHTYENTYDANYGWGICLKLGPNAKVLSSIIAVAVLVSLFVAVGHNIRMEQDGDGWTIGGWVVASICLRPRVLDWR